VILFITRQIPHPIDVGLRIRQQNLLRAYATIGKVRALFTYTDDAELNEVSALEPICADIHPVRMDWAGKSKGGAVTARYRELRSSGTLRSLRSHLFFSNEMRQAAERLGEDCRLIHVDHLYLVPHVQAMLDRKPRRQRMVLDLDDIETRVRSRWLRIAPPEGWRARLAERLDLALLAREQRKALSAFDRVLVCSEHDRQTLGGQKDVAVIPNGTNIPDRLLPDDSDGRTILCLGTYGYEPNVHGLRGFLRNVLPRIRRALPEVRVLVVGRDMPPSVLALDDGEQVQVHPDVPSVEPFYRQATISVVPVEIAGGTRLKILEAFALGRPVVSTTVGCEGLEVSHGEELLIADRPQAFADACLSLMRDGKLRARLTGRGRELTERCYTWDSIQRRLATLASELLELPASVDTVASEASKLATENP
jgi:polysaccharide biosynthesis protein PslH